MFTFIKRIIQRMLEVHKWAWRVFFPLWASFVIASALTYTAKQYLIALILFLLAIICLVIAFITVIYHIKDARRKDRETKAEYWHNKLVKAFIKTGMTKEQAEIAAKGR